MTTTAPSVAIIVRVMDRADELSISLPSLLNQDYPDYRVIIVDHCSQDGLSSLLEATRAPRLRILRCPRPQYFNASLATNIGVRYSFSDLLFFFDTGMVFRDERHLSQIVAAFESGLDIDDHYFKRWREEAGYAALEVPGPVGDQSRRRVYCECECHGLHILVDRSIFQHLGGLNETLLDWGYEDTDLTTRLELCGYGRIGIHELVHGTHRDDTRLRFFREKSKKRSWEKNRFISDDSIRTFGPIIRTQRRPGACDWIEIDGVHYAGADAPQQDWTMETVAELLAGRRPARHALRNGSAAPLVSVVVPTRNAAEYLVGALDSILSQDYPNIECLVADGGSTDATLDILASYGDHIVWTSQPDRGAFDAINRGWQQSRGEILAWLNADDRWAPGGVSAAVRSFEDDPDAAIIYGDCLIIDAEDRQLERRRPPEWNLCYAVEACNHIIDQPAAFIRRSAAQRVGWLYSGWFHDWDFWRRISLAGGKIKRVPYLLGCARVRASNTQYNPDILIGGLVGVTQRFFLLPNLPSEFKQIQRRALSNTYLKIIQTLRYGQPWRQGLMLNLQVKALIADPTNLPNVLKVAPGTRQSLGPRLSGGTDGDDAPSAPRASFALLEIPDVDPRAGTRSIQPPLNNNEVRSEPRLMVSVVVPCKNDARYLPTALESILSQDYPLLECIVVDGGSTDGTIDFLRQHENRIRWVSERDRGAFDAINKGWLLSKGDILTWLNADDLWEPGAVRTAVDCFERRPDIDVVYGTARVVDELGRFCGNLVPSDWDLEYALRYCHHVIFQPASFMRRRILERVGWLYPAWCHDHDLWLRIARSGGKFAKLPVPLAADRMRADNLGRLAEIVVPAKIALTKRFFAEPDLPPEIRRLQPRAISNAYVRAVDYLKFDNPRHWPLGANLLAQAVAADPSNSGHIGGRFTQPFRRRLKRVMARGVRVVSKPLESAAASGRGVVRAPATVTKQWLGNALERVFTRGNRGLELEIGQLSQNVRRVEQATSEALLRLDARLDRITETIAPLSEALPRLDALTPLVERRLANGNRGLELKIGDLSQDVGRVEQTTSEGLLRLDERIDRVRDAITEALEKTGEANRKSGTGSPLPQLTSGAKSESEWVATARSLSVVRPLVPYPKWRFDVEWSNPDLAFRMRRQVWQYFRDRNLETPIVVKWLDDLQLYLYLGNDLSKQIFVAGCIDPNEFAFLDKVLEPGMTVVDAGANEGIYTLFASRRVTDAGAVYAFEPSVREFERLMQNLRLNSVRNVHAFRLALTDQVGEVRLGVATSEHSGHNTLGAFAYDDVALLHSEVVSTQTLDHIVREHAMPRLDVIKLGVEGAERRVLGGGREALRRYRPMILFEVADAALRGQGTSAPELCTALSALGYRLFVFDDETGLPSEAKRGWFSDNMVAVPVERRLPESVFRLTPTRTTGPD